MEQEKDTGIQKDIVSDGKYTAHSIVFRGDKKTFALYSKAEKIVAAIYLTTNFFPPNEPLAASLREVGLSVLSFIVSFPLQNGRGEREESFRAVTAKALELASYCDIAQTAGYLSPMNASVIRQELVNLARQIEAAIGLDLLSLSPEIFTPDVFEDEKKELLFSFGPLLGSDKGHDKGHNNRSAGGASGREERRKLSDGSGTKKTQRTAVHSQEQKEKIIGRTEAILRLFKHKDKLSVKDVSSVIKNCSEKTLQRELLNLVDKGVLKKEGERRWSTYLLA